MHTSKTAPEGAPKQAVANAQGEATSNPEEIVDLEAIREMRDPKTKAQLERAMRQALANARWRGANDPEVVVNDAVLRTLRKFDPRRGSLVGLFWKIYHGCVNRDLSAQANRRRIFVPWDELKHTDYPQSASTVELVAASRRAVARALMEVKKHVRTFIVRRFFRRYSYRKTLQHPAMKGRNLSYAAIRTEISRAYDIMRESIRRAFLDLDQSSGAQTHQKSNDSHRKSKSAKPTPPNAAGPQAPH